MSERATLRGLTCRQVGERLLETTPSTATTDRMKDQVMQNWHLADYRRNPVIFWNHQTQELPIAKSVWIDVVDGKLRSRDQFPPPGLHPFADQVYDLVKAGFINAKSVGFHADRKVFNDVRGGWDFLENTLLEHSYVGLPANVEATVAGRTAPDAAAVRKWFAKQGVTPLRKDRSNCPAGNDCPNLTSGDPCPAGRLCPMFGPAHTSWRDREPAIVLLDDAPAEEYVLLIDDAVSKTPGGKELVHFKLEDLAEAFDEVVKQEIVATFGRLKGDPDYSPSVPVRRGRR